jgi:CRISPR-associated protein Cas7/Cst2/DevR subtype I-B
MSTTTPTTAFGITALSHLSLGNHNAGEGGSQLADLKTIGNRPYISGQAYRHAIRDALRGLTSEGVDCTPAHACGEIETCKICDLFGYFNPEELDSEDDPRPKRVSPLRVTPLEGLYDEPVTTDMILQYGVEDESGNLDPNIGYRELTENVYKNAIAVDVDSIGQREEEYTSDGDDGVRYNRDLNDEIEEPERQTRVEELIEAISNASQLAGQARHMADFMPDLMIAAALPTYNQRITNALHVDREEGEVNVDALESVLRDLDNMGAEVWIAGTHNPTVINNWDAVFETAAEVNGVQQVESVSGCYDRLKSHFTDNL